MIVHYAVGDEDKARSLYEAQKMAEKITGANVYIVENTTHTPSIKQPEKTNKIIEMFLTQI